jgi:hypothetical protein
MSYTKLLTAGSAAALVAAMVLAVFALPWRCPRQRRVACGWVIAVAGGLGLGIGLLGIWPHWPPLEDLGRFLYLVLPATVIVELYATAVGQRWWLTWPARLLIAAGAARVLLHNSIYLADLAGPGSAEWSTGQASVILAFLGAILAAVWIGLSLLTRAAPGRSVPFTLAMACAGAGMAIMLSKSLIGGQPGVALAGSLTGATLIALFLPLPRDMAAAVGVGTVGLFAILVGGRYFAGLTDAHALTLLLAPLLGWLPELPYLRKLGPRWRGLLRIVLVAIALIVVVLQAQAKFIEDSTTGSEGGGSLEDEYRNYGQ